MLYLNGKTIRKHRIVALQFIPNPEHKTMIDHKNRNRSDYHIENLRWCSYTENNKNKSSNLNVELEYFLMKFQLKKMTSYKFVIMETMSLKIYIMQMMFSIIGMEYNIENSQSLTIIEQKQQWLKHGTKITSV